MAPSTLLLLGALLVSAAALAVATAALWKPAGRTLLRAQVFLAATALAFQTCSLALLALQEGRAPLASQHGGLNFTAWALLAGFLGLQWRGRIPALGAFLLPLVVGTQLVALLLAAAPPALDPGRPMHWLAAHAGLSFLGLAAFGLVSALAVMYLVQERSLKQRQGGRLASMLPSLERLDRLIYQVLAVGFPLLTLGIFSGVFWLAGHQGEARLSATKLVFPLLAWTLYAVVLWARVMAGWRGRKLAWSALIGFLLAMLTVLGIGS